MIIKNLQELHQLIDKYLIKLITRELIKRKSLIILFKGHLGAGKTTIIKRIAKKLKIKENINSPTFVLWQIYQFKLVKENFNFNHIDLYRVQANDLLRLSLKSKIKDQNNLFLIEWGEKLLPFLTRNKINYLIIEIKILTKKKRDIKIKWKN
jgi:tRNA threonylcarbamoyladenosine biosynthesis protein TsaE